MELFDELNTLYSQLVKDVAYLNSSASCIPYQDTAKQNNVLDNDLKYMHRLKNELRQTYEAVSAQEMDLSEVISGVDEFIKFAEHRLNLTVAQTGSVVTDTSVELIDESNDGDQTEHESATAECSDGQSQTVWTSRMPSWKDFCISESTFNQLKKYGAVDLNRESVKADATGEKKPVVLQEMGNTLSACVGVSGLSLGKPTFCYSAAPPMANTSEFDLKPVARRNENNIPLSDLKFGSNADVELLQKTLLILPPQAPVLSSLAQQQLR